MTTFKRCALLVGMLAVACSTYAQKPAGDGSATPTNDTGAAMGTNTAGSTGSSDPGSTAAGGTGQSDQPISKDAKPAHGKAIKARQGPAGAHESSASGTSGTAGSNASGRPSQPGGVSDTDPVKGRTPGGVGASGDSTGLTAPNPPGSASPAAASPLPAPTQTPE